MTAIQPTRSCCDSATTCSCGTERTRFFAGQMVGPDDFSQDQDYFRGRMRRHNRLMHGWGIVCGAAVSKGKAACEVTIAPGFILGPQGDEILIERDLTISLCNTDVDGNTPSDCGPVADPWCSDVHVSRAANSTVYLAIRYAECPSRPVRSGGCGCGCSSGDCEYSRVRDGFVLKVLTDLPASYAGIKAVDPGKALVCGNQPHTCPPCPTDPWVILTDATIGADGASVSKLATQNLRRYVVSFASSFMLCP